MAGHLSAGRTLTPQVLVAGELSGWTNRDGSARRTHINLSAAAQYYPMVERGLFVSAGVGGSLHQLSASGGGFSFSASDQGFGATAGAGYDIRVGANFSITPYGLLAWGSFEGGGAHHLQGGLGFTWH